MELTKSFVNHCRKIGVLRDFLCQAIDQVDEKDKEIYNIKYSRDEWAKSCNQKDKEIAELKAENAQLKKETEFMHSNCKWYAGDGCARLLGEKLAIIDENVKLKQKLENVQASMYADVVDANMENRRLQRALWLARAERADDRARIFYFNDLETMLDIDGFSYDSKKKKGHKKMTARDWRITWLKVERKCREKAEEYK